MAREMKKRIKFMGVKELRLMVWQIKTCMKGNPEFAVAKDALRQLLLVVDKWIDQQGGKTRKPKRKTRKPR